MNFIITGGAYKSLVRPKLEFCCSIWDPYHQDQKDQLEAVRRKAARFVMRNYKRDSSVSTMIQQLKWQPLEERRAVSRLTFTYKALHKITAVNLDHLKSSKSSRPTRLNSSAFTLCKLATKKAFKAYLTSPRLLGTLIMINLLLL